MTDPVVIIGSGLAGYTVARELRKLAPDQPITLITASDGAFYAKPTLSNAFAQGKSPATLVTASPAAMVKQLNLTLLAETLVERIDTAERKVVTNRGSVSYASLVLAVGATAIRLSIAGDGGDDILSVNDLADYARLRASIDGKRRVAIIGAGLIGCEFANDLVAAGYAVSVIDPASQPLGRLLPPAAGTFFREQLSAAGIDWHLGTSVARAQRRPDSGLSLDLLDGTTLAVDAAVSAVGLRPATALAQAAGLTINRGIVTDRLLRTSNPQIYALGDCAEIGGLVLPFVLPLMQAARALAKTLSGTPTELRYPALPVVVKTPAAPAVVAPPADQDGLWSVKPGTDGVEARFLSPEGVLKGFALVGAAVAAKATLTANLPPTLA